MLLDETKKLQRQEAKRVRTLIYEEGVQSANERITGKAGPTPQTKAKMRPHAIESLFKRGFLDDADVAALEDIANAYAKVKITMPMMNIQERVSSSGDMAGQEFTAACEMRYQKWRKELSRQKALNCHRPVLDLAVDGFSLSEIARTRGTTRRTATKRVKKGIALYHDAQNRRD